LLVLSLPAQLACCLVHIGHTAGSGALVLVCSAVINQHSLMSDKLYTRSHISWNGCRNTPQDKAALLQLNQAAQLHSPSHGVAR
jgi:hypothetical protein